MMENRKKTDKSFYNSRFSHSKGYFLICEHYFYKFVVTVTMVYILLSVTLRILQVMIKTSTKCMLVEAVK